MGNKQIVLVEYFLTDESLITFGCRTDWNNPRVEKVNLPSSLGSSDIIRRFRSLSNEEYYPAIERSLSAALLRPIYSWTNPGDYVYLVPHKTLHYFPVHAFEFEHQTLIERNPVIYIPSASALKYCQKKRKGRKKSALIFSDSRQNVPRPLTYAKTEALEVSSLFDSAQVKDGEYATKQSLDHALSQCDGNVDVLHFATHGWFNTDQGEKSGISLVDQMLTVEEIFDLQLKSNLVTLSACQSGVNELRLGDDLVGLTRAFIFAGTPSVLASLWNVNDLSTSIFMREFYHAWLKEDKSKAEALQYAQLSVRQKKEYQRPFYWAPFILVGDWQ
jgi:CHAT domain-containing protein